MPRPQLSVVVAASRGESLRLRWLLNALYEQTLDRSLWEIAACADADPELDQLLAAHPLSEAGVLHVTRPGVTRALQGARLNAALALSQAPVIVFTEAECRPPREWLANVHAAVALHPDAIIQGPVAADPDELAMLSSPFPRTESFSVVPRIWAEGSNIVYPRSLLARIGGFAEGLEIGGHTDLHLRALSGGARCVGEPSLLTFRAVEEATLFDRLHEARRGARLAPLLRLHPQLRSQLRRRTFRSSPRSRARRELVRVGWMLIDLVELAALARAGRRPGPPPR